MNERIQEFAHRCGFTEYRGDDGADDESLTKFAELIVKECVSVCMDHRVGNQDYNTGRLHCSFDIKDHFGVKE